jgi:DNA-binding Lrp family transcriptional regulator
MYKAYVLLTAALGREKEMLDEMNSIPGIKEIHRVMGLYDLILLVEADSQDSLKQVIQQRIRSLDSVHGTITMMVCPGA